jgi:hypothetical protein
VTDTIQLPLRAFTSERRARQAGERIRDYWAARGYRVYVHLERFVDRNRALEKPQPSSGLVLPAIVHLRRGERLGVEIKKSQKHQ